MCSNKKKKDSRKQSFLKCAFYRGFAFAVSLASAFIFTRDGPISLSTAALDNSVKFVLHFATERVWPHLESNFFKEQLLKARVFIHRICQRLRRRR